EEASGANQERENRGEPVRSCSCGMFTPSQPNRAPHAQTPPPPARTHKSQMEKPLTKLKHTNWALNFYWKCPLPASLVRYCVGVGCTTKRKFFLSEQINHLEL
ncbi:mCG145229, partial [Mus musculus]